MTENKINKLLDISISYYSHLNIDDKYCKSVSYYSRLNLND